MEEKDSVLLFDGLSARRRKYTHEDGSTEEVLGIFMTVKRLSGGQLLEMQLPEILVQVNSALLLPSAMHEALAMNFPAELSEWVAANSPTGSSSSDLH